MTTSRIGRRTLSLTLTAALAAAAVVTMQGTSHAAPSATGSASPTEGNAGSEPVCANIAVVSDTELTCDVPAHAAAVASVVVGEDVDGTLANATSTSVVTGGSTVTFATY